MVLQFPGLVSGVETMKEREEEERKKEPWGRWIDQDDWPGYLSSLGRTRQVISHSY